MSDLQHFDLQRDFSAREVAALIAGIDPNKPDAELHKSAPAMALVREGYRVAIEMVTQPELTRDGFNFQRVMRVWSHGLFGTKLDFYGGFQPPQWFRGADGALDAQRFDRAEVHRWLAAEEIMSVYRFGLEDHSGYAVLHDGHGDEATPGPVPAAIPPKSPKVWTDERKEGDSSRVVRRALKNRADQLDPVINAAKGKAVDANAWASVWDALVEMASSSDRPAPLLGYVEGEGVKYQADDAENSVRVFQRESLRMRFNREKRR